MAEHRDLVRVVFREIMPGDKRKLAAESNDSDSGGGARDFRFNHDGLGPIFEKMFPRRETQRRRRGGESVDLEVYVGQLVWPADPEDPSGPVERQSIVYEPPTDARGYEGRIARIHTYPPLLRYPDVPGRAFLLLIEDGRGEVHAHYATEESLRTDPEWDQQVARTILKCAERTSAHLATQGAIDLITGISYCHARGRNSV